MNRPFCGPCNAWKVQQPLGVFRVNAPSAAAAVISGQPDLMLVPGGPADKATVTLYGCPQCGTAAGVDVAIACSQGTGEGAWSASATVSYPAAAVAEFERIRQACEEQGLVLKK